ncbi:hypothetical protein MtrunA17_Chr3g0119741 [Medicago truncatula]|uniref:Uncharacterized protein n=1 Tax=Medicago truncatula TaxID=3880 RepID=A0A396IWB2_MEDTR|nr:hypothetical protein MtrunA17_Chr3g0119741 [Medicago truncatula]
MNFSTTFPEFEMKTGIDKYRIGLRCKHESCRYGCYLSLAFGGTRFKHIELKL